jgi:hypothetical protein
MFTLKRSATALVAIILAIVVAGCNGGDDDDKDKNNPKPVNNPPTVLSTFPALGATDVSVNTNIVARFSEAMQLASINTATFTLTGPGVTAVTGTVNYDAANRAATFVPTSDLAASTLFTARVSVGAKDLAGTAMAAPTQWTFTTGTTADATLPLLTSTNPADWPQACRSTRRSRRCSANRWIRRRSPRRRSPLLTPGPTRFRVRFRALERRPPLHPLPISWPT